jgi:hypothetical protein
MSYIIPKSATWWIGVAAIVVGSIGVMRPEAGPLSVVMGALLGADGSPVSLIYLGGGLIGLRAKLERG